MKSVGKYLQIGGFFLCTAVPVGAYLFLSHPASGGVSILAVLFGLLGFGIGRFVSGMAG